MEYLTEFELAMTLIHELQSQADGQAYRQTDGGVHCRTLRVVWVQFIA